MQVFVRAERMPDATPFSVPPVGSLGMQVTTGTDAEAELVNFQYLQSGRKSAARLSDVGHLCLYSPLDANPIAAIAFDRILADVD
jgi:hypothetical protein